MKIVCSYTTNVIRKAKVMSMEKPNVENTDRRAIKEIIEEIKVQRETKLVDLDYVITHKNFTFALCDFLDEFKRSSDKYRMIENPPQSDGAIKKNLCILAAVVHKLANDNSLNVPVWVHSPLYKMPYPIFAHDTTNEDFQKFLIDDSPVEFARKNIFYGSRAIERV